MDPIVIPADLYVRGRVSATTLQPSAGGVSDAHVASDAAIAATKLAHRHYATVSQSGTAAAATLPLHAAYAAGTVQRVAVASIVAATGDSTVTVDVKKGGVSILTAPVVLDNANSARTVELGTLNGGATFTAGSFLEVVVTVSAGTGTLPTGLHVSAMIDELPI